jgi:DNA-directed RNA polymerase subunit RPC12/RpoP
MVTVSCPTCKHAHSAPESLVGKWVQCKHCGAKFVIKPGAPVSTSATSSREDGQLAQAVAGPTAPTQERHPGEALLAQLAQAVAEPTAPEPAGPEGLQAPPSAAGAKRPFGLVFVVFYWILSGALQLIAGCVIAGLGGAMGGALGGARDAFGSSGIGDLAGKGAMLMALFELVGLTVFFLGLLTLVACYGLWTFRAWGLSLARKLAIAYVAISGLGLILSLATRAGIVTAVVTSGISVGILVYLYGSAALRDRLQRYVRGRQLQGVEQQMFE